MFPHFPAGNSTQQLFVPCLFGALPERAFRFPGFCSRCVIWVVCMVVCVPTQRALCAVKRKAPPKQAAKGRVVRTEEFCGQRRPRRQAGRQSPVLLSSMKKNSQKKHFFSRYARNKETPPKTREHRPQTRKHTLKNATPPNFRAYARKNQFTTP